VRETGLACKWVVSVTNMVTVCFQAGLTKETGFRISFQCMLTVTACPTNGMDVYYCVLDRPSHRKLRCGY